MQWWWWWLFITHEPVKCLLSYWINQHYRRCYIQSDYFQTWVTSGKSCCWETMSVRKFLFWKYQSVHNQSETVNSCGNYTMNDQNHNLSHFLSAKEKFCHQHIIIVYRLIPSYQYNTKMKAAGWKIIITMMASGEEAAELGDADSGLMWKPHNIEVIVIINFWRLSANWKCCCANFCDTKSVLVLIFTFFASLPLGSRNRW